MKAKLVMTFVLTVTAVVVLFLTRGTYANSASSDQLAEPVVYVAVLPSLCPVANAQGLDSEVTPASSACTCVQTSDFYCSCGVCCDSWAKDLCEKRYHYSEDCSAYCGNYMKVCFDCECSASVRRQLV